MGPEQAETPRGWTTGRVAGLTVVVGLFLAIGAVQLKGMADARVRAERERREAAARAAEAQESPVAGPGEVLVEDPVAAGLIPYNRPFPSLDDPGAIQTLWNEANRLSYENVRMRRELRILRRQIEQAGVPAFEKADEPPAPAGPPNPNRPGRVDPSGA